MKNILTIALLSVALTGLTASAQTNTGPSSNTLNAVASLETNAPAAGKQYGGYELTLGGSGATFNGESAFGLDVSISTNPFKKLPSLWVGVAQGVYWEPTFSGSTDIFADWSTDLYKETLYLNTGWSVGALYGVGYSTTWRTGPEAYLQFYTSDNAFLFAEVNYDFMSKGENGFRYSFGIGLLF